MGSPWIFEGSDVVRLADETDKVRIGAGGTPTRALEVVGTALATLQDRGGNVFDVRAYGAKGDGVADDRVAIQAAIDALPASGGTLYLPPGNYKVTKDPDPLKPWALNIVDKAVLVRGAGPDATTITLTDTTAHGIRTDFTTASATDRELYMEIRDLKFARGVSVGDPAAGAAIFQEATAPQPEDLRWQNTVFVRNCWFLDMWDAIHLTNTGSAVIQGCQILNPKHAAIFLENKFNEIADPGGDVGTTFISDNFIWERGTDAGNHPGAETHGILATTGAPGLRVHHNGFLNFDRPIYLDLQDPNGQTIVHIDHNSLDGGSSNAKISVRNQGILRTLDVSSNDFTVVPLGAGIGIGILVDVNGNAATRGLFNAVIAGNTFNNLYAAQASQKGIVLTPAFPALVEWVVISNNLFNGLGTGIEVGAQCNKVFIGDNGFENVAQPLSVAAVPPSANRTLGAFFPDRVGLGKVNDLATRKDLYVYSNVQFRPRVYLQGDATVQNSSPGIDFAFDGTNTRRAGIVATAPVLQNNLGVQLEFFTKPDSVAAVTQRAILDPAGNLVWTTANYQEMIDLGGDAPAPAAAKARLFVKQNLAGKTQLCVRFNTGAVQVLATQP